MSETKQCNNWNVTDGRHQLRPIRCTREAGHTGRHVCGSTDWTDHYGAWNAGTPDDAS